MTGAKRQRGKDNWQVRIYRGIGLDGKKKYDSYTVKGSEKDADRFLREKLHELDRGSYVSPHKTTFAEHAENWLDTYARMHLRQTTVEGYEAVLRMHAIPMIGPVQLAKLTPTHLQKLYAEKLKAGLGRRRVQYLHTIIHGCLKHAVKWGLLARNVAEAVDPPKPERHEAQVLDSQQVDPTPQGRRRSPIRDDRYPCGGHRPTPWRDPCTSVGRHRPG